MTEVCEDCKLELDVYTEQNTDPDTALDEDGNHFTYWKPEDCRKATFLFCSECQILYAKCNQCDEFLFSTGHMGFSQDGTQHMRNGKTGIKAELEKPGPIKDLTKPRFDTADLNRTKLRVNEWMACGPDDTYPHFWACPTCGDSFSFSAK